MFSTKTLAVTLLAGSMLFNSSTVCADPSQQEEKSMPNTYSAVVDDPNAKEDSDMKAVLDAQAALKPKPIETLSAQEARMQPTPSDGVKAVLAKQGKSTAPDDSVTTQDITIPTANGNLPARVYKSASLDASKPAPVVVYYHGGGWVIATIDTYDATPREIAKATNAIVVSVEYRKAPEHKFPAAHDDSFAAYQWVVKNAKNWGGDASRVAVVGESAGGNLAINTAIMARDNNITPPVCEVLVYPVAGVDMMTPSYIENEHARPLSKAMMKWFVKNTITTSKDLQDPRIDLVGKANLQGLPPTTIITDQIDPLRSEGQALGDKLKKAGVTVNSHEFTGVTHEFFGMGTVVKKAKEAEDLVNADLNAAFAMSKPAQ